MEAISQKKGIPPFVALCFVVLCRYYDIYKLKVYGNPASSKSIGGIFPQQHLLTLYLFPRPSLLAERITDHW